MAVKTLDDLFHETLKDIYYAEKKLVKTLTKKCHDGGFAGIEGGNRRPS